MTDEIQMVPIDLIDFDEANPQVQDLAQFNDLVESMREDGFLENVVLVPRGDRFLCVSGEHRVKAARLAGIDEAPAIVKPQWDEDARAVRLIRMNAIKGRFDPGKFTDLYSRLRQKYDEEALRSMLGFSGRDTELRRMVKEVAGTMPERVQAELVGRADKIRSVEDLASTVQALFTRYGSTMDHSFVLFSHGGQTHLMIRCQPSTFAPMEELAIRSESEGKKLDELLADVVKGWLQTQPQMDPVLEAE